MFEGKNCVEYYLSALLTNKGEKKIENFTIFPTCNRFFSELKIDTKTIPSHSVEQGCRLVFVPTKFPSTSMTPSFFAEHKYFIFLKKYSFIHHSFIKIS